LRAYLPVSDPSSARCSRGTRCPRSRRRSLTATRRRSSASAARLVPDPGGQPNGGGSASRERPRRAAQVVRTPWCRKLGSRRRSPRPRKPTPRRKTAKQGNTGKPLRLLEVSHAQVLLDCVRKALHCDNGDQDEHRPQEESEGKALTVHPQDRAGTLSHFPKTANPTRHVTRGRGPG